MVMDRANPRHLPEPPARWPRLSPLAWIGLVAGLAVLVQSFTVSELSFTRLIEGTTGLADFLSRAFPPDTSRLSEVARATLETFQMALVGTAIGTVLSLPLAVLAARNTTPHITIYVVSRTLISFLRAVPDLVWALIFLVTVGLGPAAGILAIAVDTIGFCGRFFSERIEELEPGPIEALRATGASETGIISGSVLPAAFPSFVATTLFALELATRSAVVLGIVGAGGIGVELSVSMQLLRYDEALTIIIVIFIVVIAVERLSATIRRRVI